MSLICFYGGYWNMAGHLPPTVFPPFFYHVPHWRNSQYIIPACRVAWTITPRRREVLCSNQETKATCIQGERGPYCCLSLSHHGRAPRLRAVLRIFIFLAPASPFCFLCTGTKQKTPRKKLELLDEKRRGFTLPLWGRGGEGQKRAQKTREKAI